MNSINSVARSADIFCPKACKGRKAMKLAATVINEHLTLVRPEIHDWGAFFFWAQDEGWRVLPPEASLFRGPLSGWAFALRCDGQTCGFVTAVPYPDFAWIGNLIITPEMRGRGLGSQLFDRICDNIRKTGIDTIWLTASDQGKPLYSSRGFRECDRVERWQMFIPAHHRNYAPNLPDALDALCKADRQAWATDRRMVLQYLATSGEIIRTAKSIALVQNYGAIKVLGPWLAMEDTTREQAAIILAATRAGGGGTLQTDILASSGAGALLEDCGFSRCGDCALMVVGPAPPKPPDRAVALASLGSLG
jgi:GNAT superfamily N-acetyltransferase